eukprot:gene18009-biopygen849
MDLGRLPGSQTCSHPSVPVGLLQPDRRRSASTCAPKAAAWGCSLTVSAGGTQGWAWEWPRGWNELARSPILGTIHPRAFPGKRRRPPLEPSGSLGEPSGSLGEPSGSLGAPSGSLGAPLGNPSSTR